DFFDTPPSNAVGAWRFEEASGTVANDTVSANNGALVGAPTRAAGRFDQGLQFNGTTQFVNLPAAVGQTFESNITVEAWVNSNPIGTSQLRGIFLANFNGTASATDFALGLDGGNSNLAVGFQQGSWRSIVDPTPFPIGRWVHVASTYDGHFLRLYRDGV